MPNTDYDFDKSEIFQSDVLPLLKEAADLCATHGIPFMAMASIARVDNMFRAWSLAQGSPQRSPERMMAAVAVSMPAIASVLSNMAGDIAARFMGKVVRQESGYDSELSELLRVFSAVSRMGVTAHLIMRRDIQGLHNLNMQPDRTNNEFGVDPINAIDQVIRTVFAASDDTRQKEDADADTDELVGVDDLPEQFRDLFRGLFGATDA